MKVYYNQLKISSNLKKFFIKIFSLPKPTLNNLSFFISGLISAESIVTSDVSRKLKDSFSSVHLESTERRFRRFFSSFSSLAYSFYSAFISSIIANFSVKHVDKKIHISFDHMFYLMYFLLENYFLLLLWFLILLIL